MRKRLFNSIPWLLLVLPIAVSAAVELPRDRIHALYLDGEFGPAIEELESLLDQEADYSREDSVFIFKHLGVMHSANPASREKGRYYLHQLLSVEPTARILDMYASDMIRMIFNDVQEEFRLRQGQLGRDASSLGSGIETGKPPHSDAENSKSSTNLEPKSGSKGKTWLWVGGGAAIAGTVAAFVWLNQEEEPSKRVIRVNDQR